MSATYKYLKEYNYYSDVYDQGTIDNCHLFEDYDKQIEKRGPRKEKETE